jgi:hypothetical protein
MKTYSQLPKGVYGRTTGWTKPPKEVRKLKNRKRSQMAKTSKRENR